MGGRFPDTRKDNPAVNPTHAGKYVSRACMVLINNNVIDYFPEGQKKGRPI